jgi:low temperature requirement protein LtrA
MEGQPEQEVRVSTLELFFDLVFVFTITQLTAVLAHHPDGEHLLQDMLMLGVIWWMYGGFAWLTNAVAPDRDARRLLLLGGMACFLVISLTIPTAFEGDGEIFAAAYFAVILIHVGLFRQAWAASAASAILKTVQFNLAGATLILIAAFVGTEPWEYVLWGLALAVLVSSVWLQDSTGFRIRVGHFVERHGLVVIVALGESVVAVGIGASGQEMTAEMLAVAVLGLGLAAALWWAYFGEDADEDDARALAAIPEHERPQVALHSYYFGYLPILLGVLAVAAGLEEGIAHAFDASKLGIALALGGGAACFLVGVVLFRLALGIRLPPWRLIAALLALATVPLGTEGSALLQIAVLLAVLAACFALEMRAERVDEGGGTEPLAQ